MHDTSLAPELQRWYENRLCFLSLLEVVESSPKASRVRLAAEGIKEVSLLVDLLLDMRRNRDELVRTVGSIVSLPRKDREAFGGAASVIHSSKSDPMDSDWDTVPGQSCSCCGRAMLEVVVGAEIMNCLSPPPQVSKGETVAYRSTFEIFELT